MNKLGVFLMLMSAQLRAMAAENNWTDAFYRHGRYMVVAAVLCIIFVGIVIYLVLLDRRLNKLEQDQKK